MLDWKSPLDGQPMRETLRAFESDDENVRVFKLVGGRRISEEEAKQLLEKGEIGPFDDFRSPKTGNTYTALLRLETDEKKGGKKVRIILPNNGDSGPLEVVWTDPKTDQELCQGSMEYVLRKKPAKGEEEGERLFRIGRTICKKELPLDQVIKLVSEGRTDPIDDFISKRGRKFKAILVRNGAKIKWEFPPREKKAGGGAKKKGARKPAKPVDLSKARVIGMSPAHDGELLETDDSYYVRSGDNNGGRVVFKMSRTICQREIPPDEVKNLLDNGRTNLIEDFISRRGSPFKAYLVLSDDRKKANFEFPPRD